MPATAEPGAAAGGTRHGSTAAGGDAGEQGPGGIVRPMEPLEEGNEPDRPVSPLLPPDDRLWRHPSELSTAETPPPSSPRPRLAATAALASAISVLLTLGLAAAVGPLQRPQVAVEQIVAPVSLPPVSSVTDVAAVTERIRPAIVQVEVQRAEGATNGSGVLFRSDGMVLTANALVADALSVRVLLHDGRSLPATVVGADPETGVAVADLDGEGFPTAPLGSVAGLRIGQPAVTIGTPAGHAGGPVVSVGVVSAIGQQVESQGSWLVDVIQTDAALVKGGSGGAVADLSGAVIGIATEGRGGEPAMAYAIPIDVARLVAGQLIDTGRVTRGWLGVDGEDVHPLRARQLGIEGGAVMKKIKDDSPAAAAGLAPADVIIALDGERVASISALVVALRSRRPGDTVELTVVRDGERRMVRATLGERPGPRL